jgi:hypothetical protein
LLAVTITRTRVPTTAEETRYVELDAPVIGEQLAPAVSQRSH